MYVCTFFAGVVIAIRFGKSTVFFGQAVDKDVVEFVGLGLQFIACVMACLCSLACASGSERLGKRSERGGWDCVRCEVVARRMAIRRWQ